LSYGCRWLAPIIDDRCRFGHWSVETGRGRYRTNGANGVKS